MPVPESIQLPHEITADDLDQLDEDYRGLMVQLSRRESRYDLLSAQQYQRYVPDIYTRLLALNKEVIALRDREKAKGIELNDALIATGRQHRDSVIVGKAHYFVREPGQPSCFLGMVIPTDESEDDTRAIFASLGHSRAS